MDPLEGGAWQILEEKSTTSTSSGKPHEAEAVPPALFPTQQDLEGVCKVDPALVPTDAEMDEDLGYGKLLNTVQLYQKDGSIFSAHAASPLASLYKAFAQGGSFTELVMESVLKANCTPEDPWDLIIYAD